MTLATPEFGYTAPLSEPGGQKGPITEAAHWGYAIRDGGCVFGLRAIMAAVARFVGAILLMASVGLWILPDSVYGAEIFAMKLGAMVLFTVVGGYLVWAGSTPGHLEFQIDVHHGQIRVGRRDIRGGFRLATRLDFDDIASVYMLRSKDHTKPTRLFLRLVGSDAALEVAKGPEPDLDILRDRLTRDLSQNTTFEAVQARMARP